MKKRMVIVGNGMLSQKDFDFIKPDDYVIGVDWAAYWLLQQGRVPDLAIGDFDSVTEKEWEKIQQSVKNIQQFPKEKDQTDMELAVVYVIEKKPTDVLMIGGIGSRMDHTMATLHLLDALLSAHIPHALIDGNNRIRMVGRGRTILKSGEGYQYVSIIPFTKLISLKLSGFRYDLPKITIVCGSTRGISNEIIGRQAEITILAGKAWVIESRD